VEVESVYEDGEEEGLFVRKEGGQVLVMDSFMCASGVITMAGRDGAWLGGEMVHWCGQTWSDCLQANEESMGNNVMGVLYLIRTPRVQ